MKHKPLTIPGVSPAIIAAVLSAHTRRAGQVKSAAKTAAARLNASRPRPGARGETRPRKITKDLLHSTVDTQ